MRPLLLSEVFGPTVQGEGPSTGRRAAFVRLGLCNLDCSWCDTPYTWDWQGRNGPPQDREALYHQTPEELADELLALDVGLVVITGGEPMLQQRSLVPLVDLLNDAGVAIEVETNGTLSVRPELVTSPAWIGWNVSPKLSGSGVDPALAIVPEALGQYVGLGARFKFVVGSLAELDEVSRVVELLNVDPCRIWIMPEGRTPEAVLAGARALVEPVIERGWNLSQRLHVLLWGDERGR